MTALRVLIVDDLEDNGELLTEALSLRGYEARYAKDGASALALVETFTPDIAILDILMPDMNGYELGKRLKERPELARLALIAITGFERSSGPAEAAGFHGHVVKPVTLAKLEETIRDARARVI